MGTRLQQPQECRHGQKGAGPDAPLRPSKRVDEPPEVRVVDGSPAVSEPAAPGGQHTMVREHMRPSGVAVLSAPPAGSGRKRSPIFLEIGLIVFLVWIYNWIQDFAPLRFHRAIDNAHRLLSFETSIGLDPERALDHWLAHQSLLAYVTSNFYAVAIFGVTFGFAAYTWWRRPDIYRPVRNEIVLANLIAFAVFWAFPVAPPRMLPGFVDVVATSDGLGWHNTLVRHADQLAAMPSMHVGYAAWCCFVAWRLARSRRGKTVAITFGSAYLLVTAAAVLATGNHYLLDVPAGVVSVVLSVVAVEVVPHLARGILAKKRAGNAALVRPSSLFPSNPAALKGSGRAEGHLGPATMTVASGPYEFSQPDRQSLSGP
ncbi:MAG TPA: phosphatase PAP2 family protein, partial [Acidimicrobiales bacterium]|nr:phosphatase PAP2 family protein [Acidimicrobiales bacterium]